MGVSVGVCTCGCVWGGGGGELRYDFCCDAISIVDFCFIQYDCLLSYYQFKCFLSLL